MDNQKTQMREVAILYYEKGLTQVEIARQMGLTRQTVAKLLSLAIEHKVVEIKINDPEREKVLLEEKIKKKFKLEEVVISSVSRENELLSRLAVVKTAVQYVGEKVKIGNQKIGISWGRTIEAFIDEFPKTSTDKNVVFPLFGATNQEQSYFLSNEIARSFADKLGAKVEYAWFPYKPDSEEDKNLFLNTSYYKKLAEYWANIDIAIVGIGNSEMVQNFGKAFGYIDECRYAVGDVATHFFDKDGNFLNLYDDVLCVSLQDLRKAKQTIGVACGNDKVEAIIGGLKAQVIDTLITDEYTARKILNYKG